MNKNVKTWIRGLALGASVLLLAACGSVLKVAQGEVVIKDRLGVKAEHAWNQFERGVDDGTTTWTNEGVTVDSLKFYVGIKDGAVIAPLPPQAKGVQPLTFRASMQAQQIVALYESMLTLDGSSFTLDKLEPTEFLGQKGFRFEYTLNRKADEVPMRGLAVGAVHKGELFLVHYTAPRLVFFQRYQGRVEAIVRSAQLRG